MKWLAIHHMTSFQEKFHPAPLQSNLLGGGAGDHVTWNTRMERLADGRCLVADGGMGSEMERRGVNVEGDPLWSARLLHSDPALIAAIHRDFLASGADVITTASYQASVEGLSQHLHISGQESLNLIGQSVAIAAQARTQYLQGGGTRSPLIAGSVGPYGACQYDRSEYHGRYVENMSVHELAEWHRPRVRKLLSAGADLLALETIPSQKEGEALVSVLGEFPESRAWLAFSCKDGQHTCHGELFAEAVRSVSSCPQLIAVGVNCCSPSFVSPLLAGASTATDKPFVVYPNNIEQWKAGDSWSAEPESFIAQVPQWVELGAKIIGGCCTATPENITAIRKCIDRLSGN